MKINYRSAFNRDINWILKKSLDSIGGGIIYLLKCIFLSGFFVYIYLRCELVVEFGELAFELFKCDT